MAGDEQGQMVEPVVQVIRRLDLEPGDTLFLSYPGYLSARTLDQFRTHLGDALGGAKVVILEEGATVEGVLRRCEPAVLDENAGLPVGVEDTSGWPPSTGWEWDGENVYFHGRHIGTFR